MGEAILKGGTRLHRLIENYLLYIQLDLRAGIEAGITPAEKLEAVCFDAAFALAKNYNRQNDLSIEIEAAPLSVAEYFLRKLIHEIVDNAFRFSKSSTQVNVRGEKKDEGIYQIIIQNHGIGMNTSDLKKVGAFMQFERKKNEQQGVGLGLAIANRILEISGGSLQIKSEKQHWTKVIISLPLTK